MSDAQSSHRTRKIAAIAAGALVVGVGATYTLASWNDSEWVFGGADGEAGVGTATFEVEQNTGPGWTQDETNPGGALTFTADPLALTPGDSLFAPVSLRTVQDSVAGTVTLQAATPATGVTVSDAGDVLWDAITLSVFTSAAATAPACTPADFDAADWTTIVDAQPLATAATAAQDLAADQGSVQNYCFQITLPADAQTQAGDDLMGRTIAPAWEFAAVSD